MSVNEGFVVRISKLSWLGLGLSFAVMGLTACSSNEESTAQNKSNDSQVIAPQSAKADMASNETVESAEASTEVTEHNAIFNGRNVYLRGEMNDYGVQSPYQLRKFEDNKYCTLAPLRSDWSPYRFKFADAKWSKGTNFGYALPPAVIREGSAKAQLNPNSRFEELRYEPEHDGIYRFCIEFEDDVPYATVTYIEEGRLTTMDEVIKRLIDGTFGQQHAANRTAVQVNVE